MSKFRQTKRPGPGTHKGRSFYRAMDLELVSMEKGEALQESYQNCSRCELLGLELLQLPALYLVQAG